MNISRIEVLEGALKNKELEPGQLIEWGKRWFLACPRCGQVIELQKYKVTITRTAGIPCSHPGCSSHMVYPCEACGKAWAAKVSIEPSIRHDTCKLRIFVRDNRITYLSDN